MTPVRVVALGGGHGLAASLSALRHVTEHLTAVVTVADDGGSSGRLRKEFGILPPGDLRQALAALCDDDEWGRTWAAVLQHRFADSVPGSGTDHSDSGLAGHAVGNLLITALWERLGDTVDGLDWVGRLLGAKGRVLPMASVPLEITAQVAGVDSTAPGAITTVRGQVNVASTTGVVHSVALEPHDPPACPEAVQAVRDADAVVLGPGSWFTSVLPHLEVPELAAALHETSARRVLTLNLSPQVGETRGFSPERHLEVLAAHAPDFRVDMVIADATHVADHGALSRAAEVLGADVMLTDVCRGDNTPRHDSELLSAAYAKALA